MLEFKGRTHEEEFQNFFAEQHLTWDLFVYSLFGLLSPCAVVKFWKSSRVRSLLWYAAFLSSLAAAKALPIYMITAHGKYYTRHRTLIASVLRLFEACTSSAFLSFWVDVSNHNVFSEWTLLACVFISAWVGPAMWGTVQTIPNQWWLRLQMMDLARLFLSNTTAMRQVEGGLYHLTPLVGAVNALVTKMGIPPISARNMLFGLWAILQVVGGFLVPFWFMYRLQLRSRRHWRQRVLKRRRAESAAQSSSSGRETQPAVRDPGLDIRPTWTLFLPESLAFLTLSYVAGQNFKLLQYMV